MHYGLSPIEKGKLRILQNEYLDPHFQLSILKCLGETVWSVSLSYEMNEGLIILYWRQHLNLINLIDFRDQLNVALKTDYKYFLTINLRKIFGRYLPHEGGLWEKCYFQIFCSARANWPTHKISDFSDPPSFFLRITLQIFEKYDKTQNQS